MKLVEGQLEYLLFLCQFSGMSNSVATQGLRDFVRVVEQSQAIVKDVLPRWVIIEPMIGRDGKVSGDWVQPEVRVGRVIKGFG